MVFELVKRKRNKYLTSFKDVNKPNNSKVKSQFRAIKYKFNTLMSLTLVILKSDINICEEKKGPKNKNVACRVFELISTSTKQNILIRMRD